MHSCHSQARPDVARNSLALAANIPREAHGYVLGLEIKREPGADRCELVPNRKTNFSNSDRRHIL